MRDGVNYKLSRETGSELDTFEASELQNRAGLCELYPRTYSFSQQAASPGHVKSTQTYTLVLKTNLS